MFHEETKFADAGGAANPVALTPLVSVGPVQEPGYYRVDTVVRTSGDETIVENMRLVYYPQNATTGQPVVLAAHLICRSLGSAGSILGNPIRHPSLYFYLPRNARVVVEVVATDSAATRYSAQLFLTLVSVAERR